FSGGCCAGDSLRSSARADPIFAFDQAAFDEQATASGFPTFPLDQFFSFEFSPDLFDLPSLVPVPRQPVAEPASVLLLAAGFLLLGRLSWRKADGGSPEHAWPAARRRR